MQLARELRLREHNREVRLLRQLHAHMDKVIFLHLDGAEALFQIMTGALKYPRGPTPQDVVNVRGENSDSRTLTSENRIEAGIQGGGRKTQTCQLDGLVRFDQITLQGPVKFNRRIVEPIGRGIEAPRPIRIARAPFRRGLKINLPREGISLQECIFDVQAPQFPLFQSTKGYRLEMGGP